MNSVSTLAAMSCSLRLVPAARRLNRLLRCSRRRARVVPASSSSQSPTVAAASSPPARRKRRDQRVDARPGHMNAVAMHRHDAHRRHGIQFVDIELRGKESVPAEIGQLGDLRCHWSSHQLSMSHRQAPTHAKDQPLRLAAASGIRLVTGARRTALMRDRPASRRIAIRSRPAGWTQRQSQSPPFAIHLSGATMRASRRQVQLRRLKSGSMPNRKIGRARHIRNGLAGAATEEERRDDEGGT